MFTSRKRDPRRQEESSLQREKEWDITESESAPGTDGASNDTSPETGAGGASGGAPVPSDEKSEPEVIAPEPKTVERPEETQPPAEEPDSEPVQKRTKRGGRKELLDLIQRKNSMLQELDRELKKSKQDLQTKDDRLLRLAAEFENYKKRTRREWELLQKQANADLIKDIVGGIDNFDRAFANLGGADSQLQDGIRLIHLGLMDILKKAGLIEIEALNQRFDPQYHEAVGEVESEIEEGHVAQVIQRGYVLNDQVIRPARVLVSRKKG